MTKLFLIVLLLFSYSHVEAKVLKKVEILPYNKLIKLSKKQQLKYFKEVKKLVAYGEKQQHKNGLKVSTKDKQHPYFYLFFESAMAASATKQCVIGGMVLSRIGGYCPTQTRPCKEKSDGFRCGKMYNQNCVDRKPIATLSERCFNESQESSAMPNRKLWDSIKKIVNKLQDDMCSNEAGIKASGQDTPCRYYKKRIAHLNDLYGSQLKGEEEANSKIKPKTEEENYYFATDQSCFNKDHQNPKDERIENIETIKNSCTQPVNSSTNIKKSVCLPEYNKMDCEFYFKSSDNCKESESYGQCKVGANLSTACETVSFIDGEFIKQNKGSARSPNFKIQVSLNCEDTPLFKDLEAAGCEPQPAPGSCDGASVMGCTFTSKKCKRFMSTKNTSKKYGCNKGKEKLDKTWSKIEVGDKHYCIKNAPSQKKQNKSQNGKGTR